MDSAFPTAPFPGCTTRQLAEAVDRIDALPEGECRPDELDRRERMVAEIKRREAVASGDMTNSTPGERLRAARA